MSNPTPLQPSRTLHEHAEGSKSSSQPRPPMPLRGRDLLLAVVCVAVVTGLRYLLVSAGLTETSPFLLFAAAVMAAALFGGLWAGLAATFLSALLIDLLFIPPLYTPLFSNQPQDITELVLFLLEGMVISLLGYARFKTSAALQTAYDQMEQRVAQRTAELQDVNAALLQEMEQSEQEREQIVALNQRLKESNRELQDFASVASHDLQEPLRKIQAFGDRLSRRFGSTLPEQGRDHLDRMLSAAHRMQGLINDLLTFSRVTTKARPFVRVDLDQIAAEVARDLETRIEQSGATLEIGDLPPIDADPLQMRQLLQNLISNALKFARQDVPPTVRVTAQFDTVEFPSAAPVKGPAAEAANGPADEPGAVQAAQSPVKDEDAPASQTDAETIRLSVADNGIGFDEKYVDRIFNVFQRLHGRQSYQGTGIGLAICRKIVHRHGGEVTARSRPGQGTTFVVTLPRHHEQEGEHDPGADH